MQSSVFKSSTFSTNEIKNMGLPTEYRLVMKHVGPYALLEFNKHIDYSKISLENFAQDKEKQTFLFFHTLRNDNLDLSFVLPHYSEIDAKSLVISKIKKSYKEYIQILLDELNEFENANFLQKGLNSLKLSFVGTSSNQESKNRRSHIESLQHFVSYELEGLIDVELVDNLSFELPTDIHKIYHSEFAYFNELVGVQMPIGFNKIKIKDLSFLFSFPYAECDTKKANTIKPRIDFIFDRKSFSSGSISKPNNLMDDSDEDKYNFSIPLLVNQTDNGTFYFLTGRDNYYFYLDENNAKSELSEHIERLKNSL